MSTASLQDVTETPRTSVRYHFNANNFEPLCVAAGRLFGVQSAMRMQPTHQTRPPRPIRTAPIPRVSHTTTSQSHSPLSNRSGPPFEVAVARTPAVLRCDHERLMTQIHHNLANLRWSQHWPPRRHFSTRTSIGYRCEHERRTVRAARRPGATHKGRALSADASLIMTHLAITIEKRPARDDCRRRARTPFGAG